MQQARLDFFLLSEHLLSDIQDSAIKSSYRSDHSVIELKLKLEINKSKRQYWKFNNSLLRDKQYVEIVKKAIVDLKKQYGILIYNPENIDKIDDNNLQLNISDQLFFKCFC